MTAIWFNSGNSGNSEFSDIAWMSFSFLIFSMRKNNKRIFSWLDKIFSSNGDFHFHFAFFVRLSLKSPSSQFTLMMMSDVRTINCSRVKQSSVGTGSWNRRNVQLYILTRDTKESKNINKEIPYRKPVTLETKSKVFWASNWYSLEKVFVRIHSFETLNSRGIFIRLWRFRTFNSRLI